MIIMKNFQEKHNIFLKTSLYELKEKVIKKLLDVHIHSETLK